MDKTQSCFQMPYEPKQHIKNNKIKIFKTAKTCILEDNNHDILIERFTQILIDKTYWKLFNYCVMKSILYVTHIISISSMMWDCEDSSKTCITFQRKKIGGKY